MPGMVEEWFLEEFRLAATQLIEDIDPTQNECWIWSLYSYNENKYPEFRRMRQRVEYIEKVSRLSHMLFHGEIPDDQPIVLHSCDNPWCWNFHHLSAGTVRDNNEDAVRKGRAHPEIIKRWKLDAA